MRLITNCTWAGLAMLAAGLACSGRVTQGTGDGPSGPPVEGAPCKPIGDTMALEGCIGCVCGADGMWNCGKIRDAAGGVCCNETSFGMPCDPGIGNPCAGICQPAFGERAMICVPTDSVLLDRLGLSTMDGVACTPTGLPGSDCAHSCQQGTCQTVNASPGSACAPSMANANICSGTCNGHGGCSEMGQCPSDRYGWSECAFTACSPMTRYMGCQEYPAVSAGTACSDNPCITGATCDNGYCSGGSAVPGCFADASAEMSGQ